MSRISPEPRRRIAYLISQYPTVSHTFILREVRRLRALGWQIQTLSVSKPDRPSDHLTPVEADEERQTVYIKAAGMRLAAAALLSVFVRRPVAFLQTLASALTLGHPTPARVLHSLFYLAEAAIAGGILEKFGYDHVHTHFSSTVALFVSRLFPVTISMTIHGSDEFIDPQGFAMREKVKAASFVITISQYGRSQVMRFSDRADWHKVEVCRLGIFPEYYSPPDRSRRTGPVTLLCVARLVPVKGLHVLLAAVDTVAKRGHDFVLRFGGDGPERASLEQEVDSRGIRDRVIFDGWLDEAAVRQLYTQADIFVLSSFAEGVPVVLMEAMAMELACVATRVTGVPELVRDGVEGLIVSPASEHELADALEQVITDAGLRQRLGTSARARVLEGYNLNANTEELSGIFERRLANLA